MGGSDTSLHGLRAVDGQNSARRAEQYGRVDEALTLTVRDPDQSSRAVSNV